MLNLKDVWQAELTNILNLYVSYKQRTRFFFLQIFTFFFLINALCYWLAVYSSFPELLQDPLRTFKIQIVVALMGSLFDSASFFITVWLIQKASKALKGINLVAILSVDLIIAAIATAWVLLAVLVATWLIELQEKYSTQALQPIVIQEKVIKEIPVQEPVTQLINLEPEPIETSEAVEIPQAATLKPTEIKQIEPQQHTLAIAHTDQGIKENESRKEFYHGILISAIKNPFGNARYFFFGLIMGASTLLPTLFHIIMAFRTLILSNEKIYRHNSKEHYAEGYVTAVPTKNKGLYLSHITRVSLLFKKHGALKYVVCWGDDIKTGGITSFPQAVQLKDDETVVFSWVNWPSKQTRDAGMQNIMAEYKKLQESNLMPFDTSRVIYGGFEVIIDV